jgi:hypothetical protein
MCALGIEGATEHRHVGGSVGSGNGTSQVLGLSHSWADFVDMTLFLAVHQSLYGNVGNILSKGGILSETLEKECIAWKLHVVGSKLLVRQADHFTFWGGNARHALQTRIDTRAMGKTLFEQIPDSRS